MEMPCRICCFDLHGFSCCYDIKVERTFGDTCIILILLAPIFNLIWWKSIWWQSWKFVFWLVDSSCHELIKFILTILKRNILLAKLQTNKNAHARINFTAKSAIILPNGNPPLSEKLQGNGVWKFSIHMQMCGVSVKCMLGHLFRISCNIFRLIQHNVHVGLVYPWFHPTFRSYDVISNVRTLNFKWSEAAIEGVL